jgi:hypothetical protein
MAINYEVHACILHASYIKLKDNLNLLLVVGGYNYDLVGGRRHV